MSNIIVKCDTNIMFKNIKPFYQDNLNKTTIYCCFIYSSELVSLGSFINEYLNLFFNSYIIFSS